MSINNKMYVVGPPVKGSELIGKESDIEEVIQLIDANVNITINGLTRIGKSTIVEECLRRKKSDNNLCFFQYEMTDTSTWKSFYKDLSNWMKKIVEEKCGCNKILKAKSENLFDDYKNLEVDHREYIELANEIHDSAGYKFWIVVDEMDRGPKVLKNYVQELREICNSDWIRIITISRLSIDAIFPSDSGGSTFPGIFTGHKCVKGYSHQDLLLFFDDFEKRLGRKISNNEKELFGFFGGNKPFLLRIIANLFFVKNDTPSREDVEYEIEPWYDKWLRALVRMGYVVSPFEIEKMKKGQRQNLFVYDIIKNNTPNAEFCEKGLGEYIKRNCDEDYFETDVDDFKTWIGQLENMIEDINREMNDSMDRDQERYRKLQKYKNVMEAMVCKMECSIRLYDLKTEFRCNIDESEKNEIYQKMVEIRGVLEE